MKATADLLYTIFEQQLLSAMVEDETSDEFLARVVREYMLLLNARGNILPKHVSVIEADLREEVLEMMRKRTYGYYNLAEFRRAQAAGAGTKATKAKSKQVATAPIKKAKTRRPRRAC